MANFFSSFSPATLDVDVNEIYEACLYDPTSSINDGTPTHTFEALNGGLTVNNINSLELNNPSHYSFGPNGNFSSEYFRSGSFARGYHYGFNFPDRFHPSQFNQDRVSTKSEYNPETMPTRERVKKKYFTPSYSLSANVFIPWDSVVYVTFQGFFAGNGVCNLDKSKATGSKANRRRYIGDYYNNRLYIDGSYAEGTEVRSPATRRRQTAMTTSFEHRFRWHHKAKMVHLKKGYHDFSVLVAPSLVSKISAGLDERGKQQIFCGSITILTIKSGKVAESDGNVEWYGTDFHSL